MVDSSQLAGYRWESRIPIGIVKLSENRNFCARKTAHIDPRRKDNRSCPLCGSSVTGH